MSENDLSAKIRDLRAKHNLTLEQVAQQVGVGRSTVRKWETGLIANMRRDKIEKLAKALHTSPGYLMGWEDDTEPQPLIVPVSPVPSSNDFTNDEITMIHKFRRLDDRGQAAVLNVLNHEYDSLPGENPYSSAKEA